MTKNFTCILLTISLLFCFSSCESERMLHISDSAYETGLAALETIDDFIDGDITAETAMTKLDNASSLVDTYSGENDPLVSLAISSARFSIYFKNKGTGTLSKIKEDREHLADLLGE